MQTRLAPDLLDTTAGREADAILRKCVHCGFCLATCPTYGILGDELDSPRGRIYLIKQLLEGAPVGIPTQTHLDRCLSCRACETTCPSGVEYGRLLDIARPLVESRVPRPAFDRVRRWLLIHGLTSRRSFDALVSLARLCGAILPDGLRAKLGPASREDPWPGNSHPRRILLVQGCVQPALAPDIDPAAARVLDRLGISAVIPRHRGCCGALPQHLADREGAQRHARANIDSWWPEIEAGVEAIVMTASGCVPTIREYGVLLREDPRYRERAERVSGLVRDLSEVVGKERARLPAANSASPPVRIAFQAPCSLQHGLRIRGVVEQLLTDAGYSLTPVRDSHLCCGSAGSYWILEPKLASELSRRKIAALEAGAPTAIATANIGCLTQLRGASALPVRHWVEFLADRIATARP
jgi:glycolate oxidase iron-sulfur subunit